MTIQENQGKEVALTIGSLAERLAELKLVMKITNQEMLNLQCSKRSGSSWDLDNLRKILFDDVIGTNWSEGTSNGIANKADIKLSLDETCIVQSYKVFNRYASVLTEIFEKYPNIAENFQVGRPDLESLFMNSLAELYQKIKSEQEMLKLKDITGMEVMVRDMELYGLQLSWLKEMLIKVRERLEYQTKRKRLLELMESYRAKALENQTKRKRLLELAESYRAKAKKFEQEAREAEQELKEVELRLAKVQKKRRFL